MTPSPIKPPCDGSFRCPAAEHVEGCYTGDGHPDSTGRVSSQEMCLREGCPNPLPPDPSVFICDECQGAPASPPSPGGAA